MKLYFPSADEDDAMVIQSVRTKPSTVAVPSSHAVQGAVVESPAERHQRKTADPGVKSFANPQGKEISLGNSELSMSAQEGSLYISMNTHHGVSLNSTQRIQIQATGNLSLSAGSIQLRGTNGLHLNTTTDTLDLEQEVNSVSSEIQLKASLHQYYPEPLLSDFEKQVAEKGIQSVLGARVKENVGATLKGEWDAGLDFLSGVWNSAVDIADMGVMVATPFVMPGNVTGKGFLERNETLEGIKGGAKFGWNYIEDSFQGKKTKKDVVHDLETVWDGIKSIPDPIERKLKNFFPNPLTDTKQESYDAGYDSIKAVERGADIYTVFKGGAKLVRKLGKEEASLSKGIKGVEEKNGGKGGAPGLLGDTAKADSALAKAGDGKFKTNALRIPTNFESLGSYLQSISRKMNIRITKRSPILATDRGHYKFHDPGPDVPHSKGSGAKISPERQKQIDALESGEYSGKGNKGTGKNVFSYTADFEDHIINVQGIVRKKNKGVVGGHNRENFEKAFTDEGWNLEDCIIYERKHPYIDGITETKYGIPALDREGNIIVGELKSIPKPKTVYDPQKISDADIIKWGKEAMENGKVDGRVVRGSSSNGLEFEGYIDETTGKVTNVFPIVPRNE